MDSVKINKALDLFVFSDLYDNGFNAKAWCIDNIPNFSEYKDEPKAIFKPIVNALIETGKKLQIVRADITALFTEIGAMVDEETGHKSRALIGRWVNNASYEEVVAFLLGYLKLAVVYGEGVDKVSKELELSNDDGREELVVPCAISLMWCLLIETGVAAEKGLKENTLYMPSTLKIVIAIDKLSRIKTYDHQVMRLIFGTFIDVLLNNHARYNGKRPHESEITYMVVVKNAFKRLGLDLSNYVYRTLDGRDDWALFAFLTDNIS